MIDLIRELILAEVKVDKSIVDHICTHAVGKPHYDSVYNLTYNQADPQTEELVNLLEDHGLTSGRHIMEIMAGNGFETQELKSAFPNNNYTCVDHATYFKPLPGLTYHTADCTDINYRHPTKQDVIFIGSANASMCMLLTLKELLRLATFLQHNVQFGGLAVLSYFEENCSNTNFIIDYSVKQIKNYSDAYNGLYAHWFSAVKCEAETQLTHYYDLVAVSADDELTTRSAYHEISYHTQPFITRSWQTAIVTEVMDAAGFAYVGNKWNPDTRFMPFKKIKEVAPVSFF